MKSSTLFQLQFQALCDPTPRDPSPRSAPAGKQGRRARNISGQDQSSCEAAPCPLGRSSGAAELFPVFQSWNSAHGREGSRCHGPWPPGIPVPWHSHSMGGSSAAPAAQERGCDLEQDRIPQGRGNSRGIPSFSWMTADGFPSPKPHRIRDLDTALQDFLGNS